MNNIIKKNQRYLSITISSLLILFVVQYSNIAERWNFVIYDTIQSALNTAPSSKVAIIAVDDKSLKAIGAWPWNRSVHAALLTRLTSTNPQSIATKKNNSNLIAFDILFTEPDSRSKNGDADFASAIQKNARVVLPALQIHNPITNQVSSAELQYPISPLHAAAKTIAHIDAEIDPDGLVRRVYLKAGVDNTYLPALGLAVLPNPFLSSTFEKDNVTSNNQWMRSNGVMLSLNNARKRFNTYSYIDVLTDDALLKSLSDKILFIGVTASGVATNLPVANSSEQSLISSVYYHATVADALLNNTTISTTPNISVFIFGSILLMLLIAIYSMNKFGVSLFSVLLFTGIALGGSVLSIMYFSLWIPPAEIIITLLISYPIYSWLHMSFITQQLSREKEQAEVTLQSIADGVITLNAKGEILYMNPVAEILTGVSASQAIGQVIENVFNVIDQSNGEKITYQLLQYLQHKNSPHERHLLMSKNGNKYIIRTTVGNIQAHGNYEKFSGKNGNGIVLAFNDITETTNLLDYMSHQATHDTLTNLPNRALLMESLIHSLAIADRHNHQVAILFIDIDKFKNVNDGFGHETGDQLLTEIANRLKMSIREEDTVARLGGDEFVIVLDKIEKSSNIITVTKKVLNGFQQPIHLTSHEFYVTCSIGISLYPKDARNAETLLKNADIAMYTAKDRGRNNFQFFSENMNEAVQIRLVLEKELRNALEQNQLKLFYQPQVNINTHKITGVEALLRWEHEKYGSISPAQFIPLAEDSGLIIPIGKWVLQTACAQIKQWEDIIDDDFSLSINLSPRQFLEQDVLSMLKDTLTSEGVAAKHLKLEITEGVFVAEKSNVGETLAEFREMGGTVSIDDFGTGYSSLSYLNRIPVDQVKIDRHFIQDMTKSERGCSLTKAIISMANDMSLDVIAEGVENKEQLDILKSQHCFQIQGYYFSPAIEASKVTTLLRSDEPFPALH